MEGWINALKRIRRDKICRLGNQLDRQMDRETHRGERFRHRRSLSESMNEREGQKETD